MPPEAGGRVQLQCGAGGAGGHVDELEVLVDFRADQLVAELPPRLLHGEAVPVEPVSVRLAQRGEAGARGLERLLQRALRLLEGLEGGPHLAQLRPLLVAVAVGGGGCPRGGLH